MDTMNFPCPSCGANLKTNTTVAGKKVRCPKCQHTFSAPGTTANTAVQAPPALAPPPVPAGRGAGWIRGQRVFARWDDGFWYPATVEASDAQSIRITYDDGTSGFVEPQHAEPIDLAEGDRVFCRWQGSPEYHPGKIVRISGEKIQVHYDDGDQENSTVSMVRVFRGKIPWKVGDRVLAQWADPFLYPAEITDIRDGCFISVAYDDGDTGELVAVQVRALDLREGDRVYCRWRQGPEYFPGRIAETKGDQVRVDYDDGDQEWTTISAMRVMPEDLLRRGTR